MKLPGDIKTTDEQRGEFARLMSGGRMNAYDEAVASAAQSGRQIDPMDLYVYNMAVAGALLGPLHMLEVVTRNALHHELTTFAGQEDWWAEGSPVQLLERHCGQIERYEEKVADDLNGSRPIVPGDVVAASEFGFWCGLLGAGERTYADYDRLWMTATRRAFPNTRQERRQLWRKYNALRKLRNRVTHYEPIFRTDARKNLETIVALLSYISPPIATWVDDRSRLEGVVQRHPVTGSPIKHF